MKALLIVLLVWLTFAGDEVQEKYFEDFSNLMDNFVADETFSINLEENDFQEFLVIVPQGTNVIRGLYYIDSETDSDFLFIAALNNNPIVREINTRMKVFQQQVTTGEIAFRFKNTGQQKSIYFSYQLIRQNDSTAMATDNEFKPLLEVYTQLSKKIQNRQFMIKTLIQDNIAHSQTLLKEKRTALNYAIGQTVLLTCGAALSLTLLYKTIKRGFVSIV